MKQLANLDEVLKNFDGDDIIAPDTGKPVTVRRVLVNHCGTVSTQKFSGEELIKAYDLGAKIHNAADMVELDNEQIAFLQKVLTANALYTAVIMGYVLNKINEVKNQA